MPAFSAEQVANAYGLNLAPATLAMQGIGQAVVQQQTLAEAARRRHAANQLQGLSLISDEITPLEKGTGFTPIDDLNAQRLTEIRNNATKQLAAGVDPVNLTMQLQNQTSGLRAEQLAVTKRLTEIDALAKAQAAKGRYLDPTLIKNALIQQAFYDVDEKGNRVLRPKVNSNIDYTAGILNATPEQQLNYTDQVALSQAVGTELPKLFPAQQAIIPGMQGDVQGDYVANIPQTHMIDPATGQVRLNTSPIVGTPTPEFGLSNDIVLKMKDNPAVDLKILQESKKVREEYSDLDPTSVAQIAARRVVEQHGLKGDAAAKFDYSKYKRERQAQQDREDSYYKQQGLQMGKERLNISRGNQQARVAAKAAKDQEENITPNTILTQYENGTLSKNPAGMALAKTQTVQMPTPFGNIPMLQVHGVRGRQYLNDPDTKFPIKAYLFTDPRTNQKGYSVIEYRPVTTKEKGKGFDTEIQGYIRKPQPKYYFGDAKNTFRTGISDQLELSKAKQEAYNNTLQLSEDLLDNGQ